MHAARWSIQIVSADGWTGYVAIAAHSRDMPTSGGGPQGGRSPWMCRGREGHLERATGISPLSRQWPARCSPSCSLHWLYRAAPGYLLRRRLADGYVHRSETHYLLYVCDCTECAPLADAAEADALARKWNKALDPVHLLCVNSKLTPEIKT